MQLSSLYHVAAGADRVARRFPLTLLSALALCVAGFQELIYFRGVTNQVGWVFPLGSAAALGLPLTLALALAAERYRWPRRGHSAAQVGALALLAGWYVLAPAQPGVVWGTRLAVLLLGLHLAVAAAPYLGELRRGADTPGFWRYNELLFLRLLTGGLYSGVLYAGCALALVAVSKLFSYHVDNDLFWYLFVVLATVFNTWFFLAGVPQDFAALERDAPYPKGLKVFTQFVLLPLVGLYVVILYAYLVRIVAQWALPQGWVSMMVLALAVAGILALLLIHPLRHNPENTWVRTFARWFYRALFPLLGLLAVAIGVRVYEYGLTEERYFVLLLAAWLLGLASYFLARRGQGIIWIPVTLAGLAFLSAAGPWGAFAVAERSQLTQLRELTDRYHLLRNGHLDSANGRVPNLPRPVHGRLASLFTFFAERDALARLQPQFAGSLQLPDSLRRASSWVQQEWLQDRPFALSGFEYLETYDLQAVLDEAPGSRTASFYMSEKPLFYALGQGRYWLPDISPNAALDSTGTRLMLPLREGTFRLQINYMGDSLTLQQQRATGTWQTRLTLSLAPLADSLMQHAGNSPAAPVDLSAPSELRGHANGLHLRLFFTALTDDRAGQSGRYFYSAQGELRLEPK